MQKIIGVTALQRRFRAVLDEVAEAHVPYVVTRGSRPEAALLPYEEYVRYQEFRDDEALRRFDGLMERMRGGADDVADEEVAEDVAAAVREVRRSRR